MANNNIGPTAVWPNYSAKNVQNAAKREPNQTLGKDDFLKILVTQLANQDPMQPMQDKEFIAQMAQFTSVEQLTNMSTQLGLLRQNLGTASNLIGKTVEWYEMNDQGQSVLAKGIVNSVVLSDGKQYAKFSDDSMVLLDHLVSISETGEDKGDSENGKDSESSSEGADTP
ncbi:flagellar hook assembly protein FlgD [Paenibacillus gorillae]|uniref:flagellar hook assembly protein FlgD n=1 Tax=Paenibacillus gorillae TaxID=1243662 RepID=UPI0004BC9F20|nr:flagellar hook assembly protein FlgD [Paenibacillus gorillae]